MCNRILKIFFIVTIVIFNLTPFIWLGVASFLPNTSSDRGISIPAMNMFVLDNYLDLSEYPYFIIYLKNTIIVSLISSFVVTSVSTLTAYGLTRFFKQFIYISEILIIMGYLLSPIILVFPYATILTYFGLINSLCGLILANIAFCLPFSFFLMLRYMQIVPEEYDRTAAIDGANWWSSLIHIILPRVFPGVIGVSIFSFILAWNDVLLAKVLANNSTYTLAIGVKEKILDVEQTQYGTFAAASILVALIAVLVFGLMQLWIDKRLTKEYESYI